MLLPDLFFIMNMITDMSRAGVDFCYYINTSEKPGFFPLSKKSYLHRAVKMLFLSFACEDTGVTMVIHKKDHHCYGYIIPQKYSSMLLYDRT